MDLDLSPSWPPPGRWGLGLLIGALLGGIFPAVGIVVAGVEGVNPLLAGLIIALVLAGYQAGARWAASRKPRILRLKDEDLSAVMKLIDQAAQDNSRLAAAQAKDYLILHRRISKRDASAAIGKLLRRDYPEVADRMGYLD